MTVYYVGSGGNDGNAGTSWALRKLTLTGAEDIPVAAGDTVYVGPGTYRESLTVDVSGSGGSPITYIGDYGGANTDGVGGVVRVTGSDNDQTATRANCIAATSFNYRTFRSFTLDGCSGAVVSMNGVTNWIIDQCFIGPPSSSAQSIQIFGAGQASNTVQNCKIISHASSRGIHFTHTSTVDNTSHLVQNCIFWAGNSAIESTRVGGFAVKNCVFSPRVVACVHVSTAISIGQTVTVNNCNLFAPSTGFSATVIGEITENYNNIYAATTSRTNTSTGANSNTYIMLPDTRWFFEMVSGLGRMLSPFDLASYSQLVNVAGTSPTTTDMRGTSVIGANREWGALEYDPALLFRRVIGRQV